MGEPMRIRATVTRGLVDVRVVMPHAMETGRRTNAKGEVIAAHFIQNVSVEHRGKAVLTAHFGATVARNPFLHFRFKGGRPGDAVAVSWTDNRGERRRDETIIDAGKLGSE